MRKFLLLFVLLLPVNGVYAKGLDIFVNNSTASVEYLTSIGGADAGFGFLFNTKNDWVAHGAMLVFGREYQGSNKVEGGLGGKAYVANIGGSSVLALGLGGQMTYFPRGSKFGFGGYAYYAPQILVSNANNFSEIGVRAEFQMMETASMYIGIHQSIVDFGAAGSRTVDDGLHFGVNIRF
jgi:hypothetical protein